MQFACLYLSKIPTALLSNYVKKILALKSSPERGIVCDTVKSSFTWLNGMCHAFQLGGCECCMHQHTTAQCEPGDCLLLCCSHHCTQHLVCTAWWYFSGHSLLCASSAARQVQLTNKKLRSGWRWSQEEQNCQCASLLFKALIVIMQLPDASYD